MISEGRPGIDEVYKLQNGKFLFLHTSSKALILCPAKSRNSRKGFGTNLRYSGILSLELSSEKFERTGLQGTSIRSGGRKHKKDRYRKYSR